jgi:DNA-binding transcriptional MocR family regulator
MQTGYLMLQRRFFSHALWEEQREFSRAEAFLDLLQLAAYAHTKKIVKGNLVSLAPGQLCASQRYLAERWGWSTKKVRQFIALLEADQIIEPQKNREGTILTLCNYEKYNGGETSKEPPKTQTGTTEEPPRNRIKEREEEKELFSTLETDGAERQTKTAKAKGTIDQLRAYANEIGLPESDGESRFYGWESNGWMTGKNRIKDWKAAMRTWKANRWLPSQQATKTHDAPPTPPTFEEVATYAAENNQPYAESFYDYAATNGWRTKTGPIIDWRAAFRQHCQIKEERLTSR